MRVLFVHGWGNSTEIWDAVVENLQTDVEYVLADFGFFGMKKMPDPGYYDIVVGHSLGVLWLLSQNKITWEKLISICGFSKYSTGGSFPEGVPNRVIERMIRKLPFSSEGVLRTFHELCDPEKQVPFDLSSCPNQEQLMWGLQFLCDEDARLHYDPLNTFILADKGDQVVSQAMTTSLFGFENVTWLEGKGHLVPLTAPAACNALIERAITSL
ncbi:alpha/beta fold hydrolase [Kiloniella antarctica]|jgi:pimeloyl-ACP methyl ester carboxylesterase|uniref:Alpha/beta fold hydrolase n=1 Tax=Kiloniella antarctica TaxID=1550907 RepID=A0ABW5BLU4_9PROT